MPKRFNIAYDRGDGTMSLYQMCDSDRKTAERSLSAFKSRYENPDGTPRPYPNGKGFYPFSNPRVIER